ncbi:MAG TPA: RICIN domain-containing protein [Ktedonobacteraceae bacterium]|nr:RICIN domain-containing protein [Ktedonobacteraceae bacterium]
MQKKAQLLKLVVPLLTLLAIVATTFIGSLPSSLADPTPVATGTSSTSCAGHSNSGKPNSDCNSNTPNPVPGSCQLTWMGTNGGGGTVTLDTSKVTDKGLQQTVGGYNLRCAPNVKVSSCTLVQGANNSGNRKLDLANVENRSPWIFQQLNGKFGLNCNNSETPTLTPEATSSVKVETSKQSGQYFYIVSALGARYLDIQDGLRTKPSVDGIPIIAYTKDNPPTDNQLWQFADKNSISGCSYIQNKSKSGLVLDIKGAKNTATAGTPVVAFGKNPSRPPNQLWKFVSNGKNDGPQGQYGYIQNCKSGLVLDISGSSTDLRTPLVVFPKNQSITPNQTWLVPSTPLT